jgi:hypothetical protein
MILLKRIFQLLLIAVFLLAGAVLVPSFFAPGKGAGYER